MRPGGSRPVAAPGPPPWWVPAARGLIRRLPAGRFRAAARLARLAPVPFVARLPRTLGGAAFACDLGDEIARDACMAGAYEPQLSHAVREILDAGMTVLDVGANWGYFTLIAAGLVGASGRVVALEPDARMFAELERNIALNAFAHVRALPVAAADRAGTAHLEGYAEGAGNRGVSRLRDDRGAGTTEVPILPLDDVVARERLDRVDLVKIDAEGAEEAVLRGMAGGLRGSAYTRILIELHPTLLAERGTSAEACCGLLRAAGYEGWAFDHAPAARTRAAYARTLRLDRLLQRADAPLPGDPWPHMLWVRPGWRPAR